MSLPNPTTLYKAYGRELTELLEQVLAGDLVADRAAGERLVRSLGALVRLQERHRVDEHGRCSTCRSAPRAWWPWPKRVPCTVHSALSFYLRQPDWAVLPVITNNAPTARGAS
jgi:hypothetical protein